MRRRGCGGVAGKWRFLHAAGRLRNRGRIERREKGRILHAAGRSGYNLVCEIAASRLLHAMCREDVIVYEKITDRGLVFCYN